MRPTREQERKLVRAIQDVNLKQVRQGIKTLEAYLLDRVNRRDWHAVSDAANDLRVMEERLGHLLRRAGFSG